MSTLNHINTIRFDLTAEETVINETVKVIATVEALVHNEQSEASLRGEIHEKLRRFISAEWQFSNVNRSSDKTGVERVSLTATTRVSETENYDLDGRARAVSRPGLSISRVQVDLSVPQAKIDEANRNLRIKLLKLANEEAAIVNQTLGQDYVIHDLQYTGANPFLNATVTSATAKSAASYGGADLSLGNAQKLTLTASVVLAKPFFAAN